MSTVPTTPGDLAGAITSALIRCADPDYARGAVNSRSPGKQVLGVPIPVLRAEVRTALRTAKHLDADGVLAAADILWRGRYHEEELAACKMLRLRGVRVRQEHVAAWAPLLDNWLDVDELAGCLGEALAERSDLLEEVGFLAQDSSQWARRLYLAALIKPIGEGMSPAAVPGLPPLLDDSRIPVRKAAVWLLEATTKRRPGAAAEYRTLLTPQTATALSRVVAV